MNFFKRIFGKKKDKENAKAECWYNDAGEKRARDWSAESPKQSGSETYDGAQLDMAITNQIAKR